MIIAALRAGADVTDLANAYMSAVWAEERDIANPETIIAIAEEQGFDGKALFDSGEERQISEEIERNTEEAIARNVFGAPTWIYEDELFWGQDRIDFLARAIERTK